MKYDNITILLKKEKDGCTLIWESTIDGNVVTTIHGQRNGKLQTTAKKYTATKNEGQSNESSPEDQALKITCRSAKKKLDSGYTCDTQTLQYIISNLSDTRTETHTEVPSPTLANDATKEAHWKKVEAAEIIYLQPKIDGNRALVNLTSGKIYSRSRKEITCLPHLGKYVIKALKKLQVATDAEWVDGELYSHELTFNEIQSVIRKQGVKMLAEDVEAAKSIGIIVFDFVSELKQSERINMLKKYFTFSDCVQLIPTTVSSPDKVQEAHDQYIAQGYEGAIIRLEDNGYQQKRVSTLLKYKNFKDSEYKVVGLTAQKSDPNRLGAVVCEMNNGERFNARPAMTHAEQQHIFDNPKQFIGKLATVRYQNLDEKTGVPRFPILHGFRADSDIEKGR